MSSQKIRTKVMEILAKRCARLSKLIQLNAPNIIIYHEVKMMQNPLVLLEDEYIRIKSDELIDNVKKEKNNYNICCKKGCDNPIASNYDEDGGNTELGEMYCEVHKAAEELFST